MIHAFKRRARLTLIGASLCALTGAAPALAAGGGLSQKAAMPLAIRLLRSQPVTMVYLGDAGGVRGYLLRTRDGRSQAIYLWPNGRDFVYGAMFAGDGDDLTRTQMAAMQRRYRAVAAGITPRPVDAAGPGAAPAAGHAVDPASAPIAAIPALAAARHAGDKITRLAPSAAGAPAGFRLQKDGVRQTVYVTPDGQDLIAGNHAVVIHAADGGIRVAPAQEKPATAAPKIAAARLPLPPPPPPTMVHPKTDAPAARPRTIASTRAAAAKAELADAAVAPAPKKAPAQDGIDGPVPPQQDVSHQVFETNIDKAAWFRIGDANAKTVWFVADPAAPLTRSAWKVLEPLVAHHEIALRIIPVDGSLKSERLNMGIMTAPDPGKAWRDVMNGRHIDVPHPGSKQYRNASDWLNDNWVFAHDIGVTGTPFIAYEGSDHLFHSAQEPASVTLFMSGV